MIVWTRTGEGILQVLYTKELQQGILHGSGNKLTYFVYHVVVTYSE
jgi:hypothetical protein